jgi:thiol-disulfide isomerase/thioredoxin
LRVEEGFYWLNDGEETTEIYLAPNNDLSVFIDAKEFDETLQFTGSLSNENNYLARKALWLESFGSFSVYSVYTVKSEQDFLYYADSLYQERVAYLKNDKTLNKQFRSLSAKDDELDLIVAIDSYAGFRRFYTKDEEFRKSDTFPEPIRDIDFDNPSWINLSSYRNAIVHWVNRKVGDVGVQEGEDWGLAWVKMMERSLQDKKVREVMSINWLSRMTSSKEVDSVYFYLDKMLTRQDFKKMALNAYGKVNKTAKGMPSPGFTFKDRNDKNVSLDDFRGKIVYIDIWATWCGPCISEIPKLKEVKNHFKGKDVVFISICQDDTHERWIKMLDDKELKGVQLYTDNKEDSFFTDYSFNGIPRFILLDREGVIVNPNAKRPSNPELISELEGLISE